eukprot:TRINITY_DN9104_c1_g1_i1.p1 TRINITY_DN9104_c1_g1~~TRINITY_DN9104_c1_g1_i1.p1  ORF type:complete len:208 (+),score=30.42 TRINITY_DN9104_c1_g1_i1:234-857(+)
MLVVVSILVAAVVSPPAPEWDAQFSVPINQTITIHNVTQTSPMMFYYDAVNKVSRQDHGQGQRDEMCRSIAGKEFSEEPCSNFVAPDGWRYLYFHADKDSCCRYCNTSFGCGVIRRDWLSGAAYQGQLTIGGRVCDGWLQGGNEANYYYATADAAQQPCLYYEGYPTFKRGTNMWKYSYAGYKVGPQDPSLFQPWASCNKHCRVVPL